MYNMFHKLCTGGTEKTSVLQTKSKLIILWLHYLEEDVSSLVRASGELCMGLEDLVEHIFIGGCTETFSCVVKPVILIIFMKTFLRFLSK